MQTDEGKKWQTERTKLLNSKKEAAVALGISERTMDNMIAGKQIRTVWIRGRRLIHEQELQRLARSGTEIAS